MTPEQWLAFVIMPLVIGGGGTIIAQVYVRLDKRRVARGEAVPPYTPRARVAE